MIFRRKKKIENICEEERVMFHISIDAEDAIHEIQEMNDRLMKMEDELDEESSDWEEFND